MELDDIFAEAQRIYQLYDEGKLHEAQSQTLELEKQRDSFEDDRKKALCGSYVALCLVDIGIATHDKDMVMRGIENFRDWAINHSEDDYRAVAFYNLANGHYGLWNLDASAHLKTARDADDHRLARHYYREAIEHMQLSDVEDGLACQIWTNYGNSLDRIGRAVEAIDAYDTALRIQPGMGMALGNKGIALSYLAPLWLGTPICFSWKPFVF